MLGPEEKDHLWISFLWQSMNHKQILSTLSSNPLFNLTSQPPAVPIPQFTLPFAPHTHSPAIASPLVFAPTIQFLYLIQAFTTASHRHHPIVTKSAAEK